MCRPDPMTFPGAVYPIENEGGEGGFGVMQLTNPKPTYKQIWHWKENIDAGAKLTEVKINDSANGAKGYPERERKRNKVTDKTIMPDFGPEQKRMDVYSLFRGGHYWEWDENKKEWVAGLNKDTIDEDEKQEYIDSGVYHADKAVQNERQTECKKK